MIFYITDLFQGEVFVTTSEVRAKCYAQSEDCFVVNAPTNKWLHADGTEHEVRQAPEIDYDETPL